MTEISLLCVNHHLYRSNCGGKIAGAMQV